jgi:predicted alpha/beta hydrolase family esterase
VIGAELDPYVSSDLGNDVAERLGAEVLRLDGRGHWWMVDDVDPVADSLVAFWSAH